MSDHSELKKAALRVVDIESSEGESISDAWEDFESAANPAAVLALIAEIDQLKSDSLCPACEGSGEGWVRSDNGPDAHNIQVDCPECFGPGTMLGAYQAMKIQRDSQIERTVKAGGDLLFMRSERDQLKEEVEALIKRCDRYAQDPSGSKIAAIYAAAHGHLLDIHIIDKSGKSQALDAVFALRKDAERYRWLRNGSDYSVSVHEGPELDKLIDRAMSEAAKQ